MATPQTKPMDARTMARETWSTGDFDTIAMGGTIRAAPDLVRYAGVAPGERVLDVGTGTGAVAFAAHRAGGMVTGLDLAPELLEKARQHAAIAGLEGIEWVEGDATALDIPDASFDVVLSQFGHMFAPDPTAATREMLRVLKPGGRIAFSTWPAEHYVGRMFQMNARYLPPPPGPSPLLWGEPKTIKERLGDAVRDVSFRRGSFESYALSPQHYRRTFETHFGPTVRTVRALENDPARLEAWRHEWDVLLAEHFRDNAILHEYLMTRAVKA